LRLDAKLRDVPRVGFDFLEHAPPEQRARFRIEVKPRHGDAI
jgi:hypothetical protein